MKKIIIALPIIMLLMAFSTIERKYPCDILRVYDGDTVTAHISIGLETYRIENVRLAGINAPEVRGRHRAKGLLSRDSLRSKLKDKEIYITTQSDRRGKYGRLIGVLYADGENINEWLVKEGYAVYKDY